MCVDPACGDRHEIERLILKYAELIDRGDFAGCSQLFAHGVMISTFDEQERGADDIRAQLERHVIRYDDGTPRTAHLITNLVVTVAPDRLTARSHCYVTVLQGVGPDEPRPIYQGSYADEFVKSSRGWHFSVRDSVARWQGDLSKHRRSVADDRRG